MFFFFPKNFLSNIYNNIRIKKGKIAFHAYIPNYKSFIKFSISNSLSGFKLDFISIVFKKFS